MAGENLNGPAYNTSTIEDTMTTRPDLLSPTIQLMFDDVRLAHAFTIIGILNKSSFYPYSIYLFNDLSMSKSCEQVVTMLSTTCPHDLPKDKSFFCLGAYG